MASSPTSALDRPYCPRSAPPCRPSVSAPAPRRTTAARLLIIEGPAFSTRAESFLFQSWGASIISMTALPEARLAREAGMCYACLACVTDYDTWHAEHASVTVEVVVQTPAQRSPPHRNRPHRPRPRPVGLQLLRLAFERADHASGGDPGPAPRDLAPILKDYNLRG